MLLAAAPPAARPAHARSGPEEWKAARRQLRPAGHEASAVCCSRASAGHEAWLAWHGLLALRQLRVSWLGAQNT